MTKAAIDVRETIGHTGSNTDVGKLAKRWIALAEEISDLKSSRKDLKAEIKAGGIEIKAFLLMIKELSNPIDPVVKTNANLYFMQAGGQYEMFGEIK